MLKQNLSLLLKGMAMGAANVIPGVSGGTIALITGIFERLINAIKRFNGTAVRLFFTGQWRAFAAHIDLTFLLLVFAGIGLAILSLAKLLTFLFLLFPPWFWPSFFGLVLAWFYFVGKQVKNGPAVSVLSLWGGASFAGSFGFWSQPLKIQRPGTC